MNEKRKKTPKQGGSSNGAHGGLLGPTQSLGAEEAALVWAVPLAPAPSPAVKEKLMGRIRAAMRPAASEALPLPPAGWNFIAHDSAGWLTLPFPGVRMKELSADPVRDVAMVLVEMAPGARIPDHQHQGKERGLVLSGDAHSGGRLLRAGDYYEAEAGTQHTDIVSPNGCTAVIWVDASAWQTWRAYARAAG